MKKFMVGAGLASSIAIGSVVFTGGDIIDRVNTKVADMFDMISTYESNETKLAEKVNELKSNKESLLSEIDRLTQEDSGKNEQIKNLEGQVKDLQSEINELEDQLGNKDGLLAEITRLEGEVSKANNKVAELESILNRPINDIPLTDSEIDELLSSTHKFDGTIYFTSESADETVVQLSSYAELHVKRFSPSDGPVEFSCTVRSITDDGFDVEIGNDGGSQGDLCHPGQPFTFKLFLGDNYNYTYIKINNGEFTYKLVVE